MNHINCDCPVTAHERLSATTGWIRGNMSGFGVGLAVAGAVLASARSDGYWRWLSVGLFVVGAALDAWQRWLWVPRWERR